MARGLSRFWRLIPILMAVAAIAADPQAYDHPSEKVIDKLEAAVGTENIHRTDLHGTTEFITDGKKLWLNEG